MEDVHAIADKMIEYGGSFVKNLGKALHCADPHNVERIRIAFQPTWERYRGMLEVSDGKPLGVCFSGSTRFLDVMAVKRWEMERDWGAITLGCHLLPDSYGAAPDHQAEVEGCAEHMDELHCRKIDMSDELYVINVGGYIGEATRREIDYALSLGKPVQYLEPER